MCVLGWLTEFGGSVLNRHLSAAGIRSKHIPSSCCCSSAGEVPTSPSIWTQNYVWTLSSIRNWVLEKRLLQFIVPECSDLALPFLSLNSSQGKAHALSPHAPSLQSVRKHSAEPCWKWTWLPKEPACTLTYSSSAELDNELYKACTQAGKLHLLPENKSRVLGEYTFQQTHPSGSTLLTSGIRLVQVPTSCLEGWSFCVNQVGLVACWCSAMSKSHIFSTKGNKETSSFI